MLDIGHLPPSSPRPGHHYSVVVWRSGNELVSINEVNLRRLQFSGGARPGRARSNWLEDPPPWLCPAYCFDQLYSPEGRKTEEKTHT